MASVLQGLRLSPPNPLITEVLVLIHGMTTELKLIDVLFVILFAIDFFIKHFFSALRKTPCVVNELNKISH